MRLHLTPLVHLHHTLVLAQSEAYLCQLSDAALIELPSRVLVFWHCCVILELDFAMDLLVD